MKLMRKVIQRLIGLTLLLSLLACDSGQIFHKLRPGSKILAFGDSLTHGTGAAPGQGYPEQLEALIARKVINAGVPGEVSAEGVRRLPALLDEHQPDLVIICHGGNDLLRKLGKQQLSDNLRRMFEAVNQRGIPLVMVAVPEPALLIDDADLYTELSKELNIPLIEDVLAKLLADRQFKSDRVHLNAAGYGILTKAIADKLYELRVI
jgi:lysophospholipase L1-like esterase